MSLEYKEQLSNGSWQEKRLQIFNRDNFSCTICGSKQNIQLHHKDYLPDIKPWEYPSDMLTTLCGKHHKEENPRERIEGWLSNSLRMKGFMVGDLLALSTLIDNSQQFTESLLKILRSHQNVEKDQKKG